MKKSENFSGVLEAAENLPLDAQEELIEILKKRGIEQRRGELARDVRNARSEYKRGRSKPSTVKDIMQEIVS